MYSLRDGAGLIGVLSPLDVDESEKAKQSRNLVPATVDLTDDLDEVVPVAETSALPPELQPRGLRGLLVGRISTKIVLPFIAVIAIVAIGGTLVVQNLVTNSLAERFQNQLLDAGKNVNDSIIKVEGQQLELLRLMSNTEGVDVALANHDAAALQKLLVPLQANSTFSFVDVVDVNGKQVLALRPNNQQFVNALDPDIANWDVTKNSIANNSDQYGNKYTTLSTTSFGRFLYTGGPVLDTNNKVVGAIIVGMPFEDMLSQLTKDVVAQVTVYRLDGTIFGSSLKPQDGDATLELGSIERGEIFAPQPQTIRRPLVINGEKYLELLGGLVIRDKVGAGLGVALQSGAIEKAAASTRIQLSIMFIVTAMVVIVIGLFTAQRISTPIRTLVRACQMVARGEFGDPVDVRRQDETGVLAHTFNQMVDGLKERDRIRDTFGRYMTQQVSDAILKGDVNLGGETRVLTMLMSDIRSFTTLSETMEPEDLVGFLNRYFSEMIDCVVAHDGVVDKFMGDAILVVYGAPVRNVEHPLSAVLTALDMRDRLATFNAALHLEGHPPIRIGIGVNTGEAVTGNIGSEVRMEYTVIGDAVNSTQRTEDLTKEFKTDILISEATAAHLDGRFLLAEPHRITLRGRKQESLIFPVIGIRDGWEASWADRGPLIISGEHIDVREHYYATLENEEKTALHASMNDAPVAVDYVAAVTGNGHNGNGASASGAGSADPQTARNKS